MGGTVNPIKAGRVAAVMAAAVGFLAVGASSASERAAAPGPAPAPLTSVGPGAEQDARHELTAADAEAWLNGLLTYGLKSGDIAGAVISIVKDGKVLYQAGYGYADVEKRRPMDPERVMTRIGSTSKLFTWTAVMQLVQQGKLDLNRNVDDYLDFKVSPAGPGRSRCST